MLPTLTVHPEGPRYQTPLVFLPGLWTPPAAMRPVASFLGHRGWNGLIVDVAAARGGVAERASRAAEVATALAAPPMLIGHDAGGLIALEWARRATVAGIVWLAPLAPADRRFTRLVGPWRLAWAFVRGGRIPRPGGAAGRSLFGSAGPADLHAAEQPDLVRDIVRGRVAAQPAPERIALVQGEHDPVGGALELLPGVDRLTVAGAGRWLLGGPHWQQAVGAVHRWLVRRLGVRNLEFYEEAMAERGDS